MQKFLLSFIAIFFIGFTTAFAQKSEIYTNDLVEFNNALSLFNNKQYLSAQIIFDRVKQQNQNLEIQSDCTYYSANCAIRLNQDNADEAMESFVKNYPTSTKQNLAYTEVATYYFEQGKYPQALEWFDKVEEGSLTNDDLDKYNFYKGYSFFNSGKKKKRHNTLIKWLILPNTVHKPNITWVS